MRGVTLDPYLFDDDWDNHASLWSFKQGFPDGFTPIKEATAKYGTAPGILLSPWGRYSKPKQERVEIGKAAAVRSYSPPSSAFLKSAGTVALTCLA